MKRNIPLFALAAALCFVVAPAQSQAPGSDQTQTAPLTKEQKKAAWEAGVKKDCSAEIADGGVCAGKDFGTGLEKCLRKNRPKLSDGCRVTVRPRRRVKPMNAQSPAATTPSQP